MLTLMLNHHSKKFKSLFIGHEQGISIVEEYDRKSLV